MTNTPSNHTHIILSILFTFTLLLTTTHTTQAKSLAPPQPPNIILIMADDMGYSDIGCYGGEINTPTLDRLASNGLRFTQFYNTGRCCPTRASLLTGLYPHQAGVGHMMNDRNLPGYRGKLNETCVTIAQALRQANYRTYMSGKWHVSPFDYKTRAAVDLSTWPRQRGFDRFFGTIAGGGSFYNPPGLTQDNTFINAEPDDFYYTDAISDHAVQFIKEDDGQQPLFLYVAYTAPHWPLHAPADAIAKYNGVYDKGWQAIRTARFQRMKDLGLIARNTRLSTPEERIKPWADAENKAWEAHRMSVYAAQIEIMDQGIGRIVNALKETNRFDNTLILFLADNGGCEEVLGGSWLTNPPPIVNRTARNGQPMRAGNHPDITPGEDDTFASYGPGWANASNTPFRMYKHWVHEGGIATPLVVHWPNGIKARGQLRHEPSHLIDIMPTCLDLAHATYPKQMNSHPTTPLEGQSLTPVFAGQSLPQRPLYWEHERNKAIRIGNWKLVEMHREGKWELYDLETDRTETNDLSGRYPERVESMANQWQTWAERANVLPMLNWGK